MLLLNLRSKSVTVSSTERAVIVTVCGLSAGGRKSPKWHNREMVWSQNQTVTQQTNNAFLPLWRWRLHISGALRRDQLFCFTNTQRLIQASTSLWSHRETPGALCWARIHLVILIKAHQCNRAQLARLMLLMQRPWAICKETADLSVTSVRWGVGVCVICAPSSGLDVRWEG